ncbi:FAD-binding domain-containing protein [Coniochaeta hoffmannii]|uniref:FAD-binding domain-containing protein n=1 Tax=Coniochaeta hoffmannii TaxID=91930 RepID=A0AA38RX14_9PEZI|nr:FAD-binding domain-containing protein [Coniochaeta hoffmannii]
MGNSGSSLQTCLNSVCNGRSSCVSYPSNPLYQLSWVKPYNLDIGVTPVAVIRPQTAADISAIVKCATANNVKIQAKSGGHSYANYGLGGTDGAISIDMVNFQEFSMDNRTWQATIGAGTLLGDVSTRLHKAGGRAIAHGTCPGVGMGGHATIGGLGPASRMWGSTLDHVVEVEVVTADGNIQLASETQNSDLFWAVKGAGASFGVVTKFVVKTHPEPGSVVQFTYTVSFGKQADMAPTFNAWQTLVSDPDLDRRFASEFIMEPLGCVITGTFYGSRAEFNATGLQSRFPKGGRFSFTINDWLASVTQEATNEALYISNTPIPFYSKSLAFTQKDVIPASNVTDTFKWIDGASKGTLLWFIIFDVEGGAINDVPQNATAYPHRDKFMFYQSYAIGLPLSQTTKNFLTDFHNRIVSTLPAESGNAESYAGYVDPGLGANAQQDYWGPNLPRLEQIKKRWDPSDVFHNPQSVRPAAVSTVVP